MSKRQVINWIRSLFGKKNLDTSFGYREAIATLPRKPALLSLDALESREPPVGLSIIDFGLAGGAGLFGLGMLTTGSAFAGQIDGGAGQSIEFDFNNDGVID